jgi:hypothetical protein
MNSSPPSNPATMPAPSNAITPRTPACRKTPRRRVGRDLLVAHERGVLARSVFQGVSRSEGDRAHPLGLRLTDCPEEGSGRRGRVAEWRGDGIFRERFFYDPSKPKVHDSC